MTVKIILNMEKGYRVQTIKDNGFVDNSIDIEAEELPILVRELCEECVEKEEQVEQLLAMLRQAYEVFKLKSMTFKIHNGIVKAGG